MKKILFLIISILFLIPISINAEEKVIDIYLFHSESCPHCKAEITFLEDYILENKDVRLHLYEVSRNKENSDMHDDIMEVIGKTRGVPYTVIGSEFRSGFGENTKNEIKKLVNYYRENDYKDYVSAILSGEVTKDNFKVDKEEVVLDESVSVPFLGKVDPKKVSLPIIAVVIGLVDGFNPCAMWVLIFLITMLLNMKDKKRMWILGITFILTSGAVYFLFMDTWRHIVFGISDINYVRVSIGIFAIGAALYNLRNYYKDKQKEAGCEIVDNKKRKKIIDRIRKFTKEESLLLAMIGVMVLALSVNIVELACSAGLPLMFTQILAINELSTLDSTIYMLIYILFFLIDDLIVFTIAMTTFKVTGITTKYTKYSHLIGGLIMFILGLLLIFKPEWVMFNF